MNEVTLIPHPTEESAKNASENRIQAIKQKVTGDAVPEIRKMTRSQAREYRKLELDPMYNRAFLQLQKASPTDPDYSELMEKIYQLNDRSTDWILANIYPEYDFDDANEDACAELAAATYRRLKPMPEDERKNS